MDFSELRVDKTVMLAISLELVGKENQEPRTKNRVPSGRTENHRTAFHPRVCAAEHEGLMGERTESTQQIRAAHRARLERARAQEQTGRGAAYVFARCSACGGRLRRCSLRLGALWAPPGESAMRQQTRPPG